LTNFWRVLQSKELFPEFHRLVSTVNFSAVEFHSADSLVKFARARECGSGPDPELAAAFFVLNRQSLSGRMKAFTGITINRLRGTMSNEVCAWLSALDGLPAVHARWRRVLVLPPRDGVDVIIKYDSPATFFYLDPTYLPETRSAKSVYEHEMAFEQHEELLETLADIQGKFLLSGYDNPLYRKAEASYGWGRREVELPNNAAGGKTKRRMTEIFWANYELPGEV
jgi:DNA adenine methylase